MVRLNIDHDYLTDILQKLLETPSPTGFTDTIVRLVSKELINLGLARCHPRHSQGRTQ